MIPEGVLEVSSKPLTAEQLENLTEKVKLYFQENSMEDPQKDITITTSKGFTFPGKDLGSGVLRFNMKDIRNLPQDTSNFKDVIHWATLKDSEGNSTEIATYGSFSTVTEIDEDSPLGTAQHILYVYGVNL